MRIEPISLYSPYPTYGASRANRALQAQAQGADKAQTAQRSLVMTAHKAATPETPVQPVNPVRPVSADEDPAQAGLLRYDSDAAAMAVRMRIQYPGAAGQQGNAAQAAGTDRANGPELPGLNGTNAQSVGADKAKGLELPGLNGADAQKAPALEESKSAQEVMEEGECQTCKERKYQDGSDDPGVSFKTPTNVAPEQAASAVRGHENEHVVREQAKAQRDDRKVVSQSVTYHTDICPECGKVYVSGGETRTVTKADTDQQMERQNQQKQDPTKPAPALA